ncbi:DUF4191 domain-containing protein [Rhizohabitans arisaemae]|uniref:DUF4191 domain-containing protein n=1 Tax=Rhizohabitans arisaemae TaxID=2720610 RepID=UPI0024B1B521|nr:DUF4191 domain-containing protein [Rhizohabitans arisaemae]
MAKPTETAERPGRLKQIRMIASFIHKNNRTGMPIVFASALGTLILFVVIGVVIDLLWYMIPLGIMTAAIVGLVIFGRLAQKAQYAALEGQLGGAAVILESMRGNWTVTPAVVVTREQHLVHRVVGPPGIVLVSEGPGNRTQRLLQAEKKRLQRVVPDIYIYDIQCGDAEGQIPLKNLQRHVMKLPRNLRKPAVMTINDRLRTLPSSVPIPKGPLPKGMRMPKGVNPKTR